MSSGGGGTNTVQQQIPDWMQGYIQNNYQFGKEVASIPYSGYQGQGTAPVNAQQQAGISTINNAGAPANTMMTAGANSAAGAANYNPQMVAPTASSIGNYLSPYLNQVRDTTNLAIQQQGDIQNQQIAGNATAAGAYGGSRQAVQEALNNKYTQQNIAQADAAIGNQGFNTALGADLQAQQANQQAGLTGNAQRLQAGVDLGAIGQGYANTNVGLGQAQIGGGTLEQQTQQNANNFNYGQWYNQMMWPYQQLSALTGSMYGGSVGGSTTQPTYSNNTGNAIGSGLAAAGVAGALGASGMASAGIGGGVGLLALLSDPAAKQDRTEVDPDDVLKKLRSMPIDAWRYKPEIGMGAGMHLGAMADDFAQRFGGDGHSIPVVDAIGVSMAAIKALADQVERLKGKDHGAV
ncbi:MAG TPA: hypothetical protein VJ840_18555 [Gemmatimonadaceae bacterium]|nr:hypothetical protein [Gemmatimonadaceae bacterium]